MKYHLIFIRWTKMRKLENAHGRHVVALLVAGGVHLLWADVTIPESHPKYLVTAYVCPGTREPSL